jgi:hypothetical protein
MSTVQQQDHYESACRNTTAPQARFEDTKMWTPAQPSWLGKARLGVPFLILSVLSGCGGSSTPTAPVQTRPSGWPAGTVVTVVAGDTGEPCAGSRVTVGGQLYLADGAGRVTVQAPLRATVKVEASRYLTRQTLVRTGETKLTLWPDSATLPGEYTRALVYTREGADEPLRRLPSRVRTVEVSPSAEIRADPWALRAHRRAAENISSGTQGRVVYHLAPGDFVIETRIDPGEATCTDAWAFARLWLSRLGDISRAEIIYCDLDAARAVGTITHELGHTLGLRHSIGRRDLMSIPAGRGRSGVPTDRERLTIALMYQRRSGNVWPDNDRDAIAALARGVITIID